jgi:hypothetical protein
VYAQWGVPQQLLSLCDENEEEPRIPLNLTTSDRNEHRYRNWKIGCVGGYFTLTHLMFMQGGLEHNALNKRKRLSEARFHSDSAVAREFSDNGKGKAGNRTRRKKAKRWQESKGNHRVMEDDTDGDS